MFAKKFHKKVLYTVIVFCQEQGYNLCMKRLSFSGKQIRLLSLITFWAVIIGTIFFTLLFVWYAKDLPVPGKLTSREISLSTKIYDRNGELLYDVYGDQNRTWVPLSEIPPSLRQATIAIEDKDFYKHKGFDPLGIFRALKQIIINRSLTGGSTLTQQLVKTTLLSPERTLTRKFKEFILAMQVERKYSKDEILEMYLNEAPYGGTAWGVEAASEMYFGVKVKDLNIAQTALLAGLPQRPTAYSPFGNRPDLALWRKDEVLRRMKEDGYLNQKDYDEAKNKNITYSAPGASFKAPHFIIYVKEQLVDLFGEKMVETGGLQVTTTLDWKLQQEAQKIVAEEIEKIKTLKVSNGAAITLDVKTGQILSMVGSKDYKDTAIDGNVNVVLAERQPGSAGKPIVYATAFQKGYTPSTILFDAKTEFPTVEKDKPMYIPENYDGKFRGPVTIRFALANSINIPAVKMVGLLGTKEIMKTGFNMGLTTWDPNTENLKKVGLSLALGGRETRLLDLASAYSVFANQGLRQEPISILKVMDNKGKVLLENKETSGKRALSAEVSFLINKILSDDDSRKEIFGLGSLLNINNRTVAVKTGTTDQKRDNWAIGYTPSFVTGVWVGNNDNTPMAPKVSSGVTGATPIWNRIMKLVLKDQKEETWTKPENVVETDKEFYIKGTEPAGQKPNMIKLNISKHDSNKLANDLEFKTGDYEEKEFYSITEKDPVSTDGKNRWQEGIDKWLQENVKGDSLYKPPTEISDWGKDKVEIRINSPSEHQRINDNEITVKVEALSLKEIVKLEIYIDGDKKKEMANNTFEEKFVLSNGTHKLKVLADDSAGNAGSSEITFGVNQDWDYILLTPTLTPVIIPTALTPSPTP